MNIGIVGKGSVGKCLAHGIKQSNSNSLKLLLTSQAMKSLQNDNLLDSGNKCTIDYYGFDCIEKAQSTDIPITQIDSPYSGSKDDLFDVIIVPTKAFQSIPALRMLNDNKLLQNNPTVVLFHNGIIPLSVVPECFQTSSNNMPQPQIVFGTTSNASTLLQDDHQLTVRQTGFGPTWLGNIDFNSQFPKLTEFSDLCDLFESASFPTTWFDDIEPHLLIKLAINCCINPLAAIHQIRNDGLIENDNFQLEMYDICCEVSNVMRAYRNDIFHDKAMYLTMHESNYKAWDTLCNVTDLFEMVNATLQKVKLNYCSMNRDIHFGRQTEIDQINGHIVRLGEMYNVGVTMNEQVVRQIHQIHKPY